MIGIDLPPNDFVLFGLNLTDPTDFVYDFIMGVLGLFFAYKLHAIKGKNKFSLAWFRFFLIYGLATFFSAFGHLFYNYYYYYGKLLGWLLVPLAIYWIEIAMLEAHWSSRLIEKGKRLYKMKLLLVYLVFVVIWTSIDVLAKPSLLFLPIAINSILGLLIGVGIFSYQFKNKISASFASIFVGIAVIFPSAFIFIFKINLHQWFSKNDFSHILMIIGLIFFYRGVSKILKEDLAFLKA
ncbi:MAG: hypothetical protein ABF238_00410 [Flavobacteriales bacterium]